jgi:hypothetical protein
MSMYLYTRRPKISGGRNVICTGFMTPNFAKILKYETNKMCKGEIMT